MTDQTKDKLIRVGTPTGSRYFGCATAESDYDYFVKVNVFCHLSGFTDVEDGSCKVVKYDPEEQIYAIKFFKEYEDENREINIIILKNEVYEVWVKATEDMLTLCSLDSFKNIMLDKSRRIKIFKDLKRYHKMMSEVPF